MQRVVMLSFWRDDARRNLSARAYHLLTKTHPALRYVWVVGDSCDATWSILQREAEGRPVQLLNIHTGIPERFERLSFTANVALGCVGESDDVVMIHESDLISPPDVVEQLLATGKDVVGGWPVLTIPGHRELFYDTWGYHARGACFQNTPPYHAVYRPDALFRVDGVGSVWAFPAADVRDGLRCETQGARDLCRGLRQRGHEIWVAPWIKIVQPYDLWVYHPNGQDPVEAA